jgi:hypothetical protein
LVAIDRIIPYIQAMMIAVAAKGFRRLRRPDFENPGWAAV